MAFPKGLKFKDRRATLNGDYFLDCSRRGHPVGMRRVKRSFGSRSARETYLRRHDALYHDRLLAAELGIEQGPTLGEVVGDFMQHFRKLADSGKRDPQTVRYYDGICQKLLACFGSEHPLRDLGRRSVLHFADYESANGSSSQGARFVKAAKVVKRLQKFAELPSTWEVPTDDISPVSHPKEAIDLEDIRDFLRAMEPGSLEHVFSMTKLVTMLRNEELYAAEIEDLRLVEEPGEQVGNFMSLGPLVGELSYWLRNKQTGEKVRHVTFIPHGLALLLKAWTAGRTRGPLFTIGDGRRLTAWSLRKRFLRASERATARREKARLLDPDGLAERGAGSSIPSQGAVMITAIGQFRAEGSSLAQDELQATYPVSEQLGHKSEVTTRKHYKLRRKAATLKQSKRVTESVEAKVN